MAAGNRLVDSGPAVNDAKVPRGWLVGPWFDLLLMANLAWPLVLALHFQEGFSGRAGVQFWQLYFITTPHRWITLALVFLDRERLAARRWVFVGIAAVVIAACLGVRIATGTLTCLLTIDYLWNAWHFAAQHHGVYRIYGRLSEPNRRTGLSLEKWILRLFVLYVIVRVAGATWANAPLEQALGTIDWLALAAPIWLIARDVVRGWSGGRTSYLASMLALYGALLYAAHFHQPGAVLALATASALFHAIEYLALVTWSARNRYAARGEELGLFARIVPRWSMLLLIFIAVLGSAGWLLDQHLLKSWLLVNVIVAFLHYAYDGLIWRQRA
jgi:hypothetical protein